MKNWVVFNDDVHGLCAVEDDHANNIEKRLRELKLEIVAYIAKKADSTAKDAIEDAVALGYTKKGK